MRALMMLTIPVLIGSCNVLYADCRLNEFDRTPPVAVSDEVDGPDGTFKWGSDVDQIGNLGRIWNYVENIDHSTSINVKWEKAGIKIEFVRPLPPGGLFCNRYFVKDMTLVDLDDDATIIYGNRNTSRRAAVYSKKQQSAMLDNQFESNIETSYIDNEGKVQFVDASFFYSLVDQKVTNMAIVLPDGYSAGLVDATAIWNKATVESALKAAASNDTMVQIDSLSSFSKAWATTDYFSSDESLKGKEAIIFNGTVKDIAIGKVSVSNKPSEVVIFNQEREPVASGIFTLPVFDQ